MSARTPPPTQTSLASLSPVKKIATNQPFTVFIEGNIGSGKTTYLNHFQQFEDVHLLTEPVEKWRDCGGVNLLDLMYKDPERWAMPFQMYVLKTILQSHTETTDKCIKLMERSIFSAKNCFVENMLQTGILHRGMYNIIDDWYQFINSNVHLQADLIVYLQTTPEIVYERMKNRARSEESCVSLDYLKQLHVLHEDWLIHGKKSIPCPVLVLDGNLDMENIGREYKRSENSILKPILQHPITVSPSKMARRAL